MTNEELTSSILQEEAFLAPERAIRRQMQADHWVWGSGFASLRSKGKQVVFHGLSGSVSNRDQALLMASGKDRAGISQVPRRRMVDTRAK